MGDIGYVISIMFDKSLQLVNGIKSFPHSCDDSLHLLDPVMVASVTGFLSFFLLPVPGMISRIQRGLKNSLYVTVREPAWD